MAYNSLEVWHAETVAEAVLTLFVDLEAERESTGGHRLTVSLAPGAGPGAKDKTTPDDTWSWLITVGVVLRAVRAQHGPLASTILIERYAQHKTIPWIAIRCGLRENVCQGIVDSAVVYFAQEMERRGLLVFVQSKLPKAMPNDSCLLEMRVFPELHQSPEVIWGAQAPFEYASVAVEG